MTFILATLRIVFKRQKTIRTARIKKHGLDGTSFQKSIWIRNDRIEATSKHSMLHELGI